MAVSNVELRVDARQAVNALQQTNAASQKLEQSTQKLTNALGQQQRQATTTAKATNNAFGQLITTLGGVAAAYGQLRVAQQAVQAGIQREESVRRLQFLAKGYNEVTQAQLAAARAGQQFGLSATESNQQFAQLYGRLRPLKVGLQDIEASFIGFNTAAKVSGASTAESAGAFLQLSQALGSGVLRGEELNSIIENAPGLVVGLTQELGKPVSEIRKLAEEGQITSDIVIRALKRAATEGADELAAAMQGPSQQIKNLQNAFEEFQVTAAQVVMPAVIESIKRLTRLLQDATQYTKDFSAGWQIISSVVASAIAPFQGVLDRLADIDARLRSIGQSSGLQLLASILPGTALGPILNAPAELGRAQRTIGTADKYGRYIPGSQQVPFAVNGTNNTRRMPTTGGGGGSDKAAKAAERAAKAAAEEQARVAEVIRSRLAEGQLTRIQSELKDKIAAAELAGDKQLAIRLQGKQKELDIQYRFAQELAREKDIRAQEAIIFAGLSELTANQRDVQRELIDLQIKGIEDLLAKQSELTDQQKQQQALTDSISNTIGQGMTSAFDALVQGSENFGASLQKIASGVLIDIAKQLLQVYVIQQAIQAIGGAIGGLFGGGGGAAKGPYPGVPFMSVSQFPMFRAKGGSVMAGQPYIVGERGPELFMPGRSGGIAPTGSFGGGVNVVVNVDASGTNVQGNQSNANQLGRAVSAAVQAELIKQQRPGGLLSGTR